MKKYSILIFYFFSSTLCFSQNITPLTYSYPELPSHISKDTLVMNWHQQLLLNDAHTHASFCNEIDDYKERFICSEKHLKEIIQNYLVYPDSAWKNNIEGIVIIKIIVEKDGSIHSIELVHDIGYGCGEEALKVFQKIKRLFEPRSASRRGVRNVRYIPVEFYKYGYYIRRVNFKED